MSPKGYATVYKTVVATAITNYDLIRKQLLEKRNNNIEAVELTWWENFTGVTKKDKYFEDYGWGQLDEYGQHTLYQGERNALNGLVKACSFETITVDHQLAWFINNFKEGNNV